MSDIVERLRWLSYREHCRCEVVTKEAADEIERLHADIEHYEADRIKLDRAISYQHTEIERLQAALAEYGLHRQGCGVFDHHATCTCGFDAALLSAKHAGTGQ